MPKIDVGNAQKYSGYQLNFKERKYKTTMNRREFRRAKAILANCISFILYLGLISQITR